MAKVSKILQLMETGNAAKFKNKSLDEIDIDMETIVEAENVRENVENLEDGDEGNIHI